MGGRRAVLSVGPLFERTVVGNLQLDQPLEIADRRNSKIRDFDLP